MSLSIIKERENDQQRREKMLSHEYAATQNGSILQSADKENNLSQSPEEQKTK
jgi:hypothetical protein